MKFRFLGTAAAEGFPAIFCRCTACEKARKIRGRNIRTRAQALINDDFLLDFPEDTYWHAIQNKLYLDQVKYVFFTHSHMDHCTCIDLAMRGKPFAHDCKEPLVSLYGNAAVKEKYEKVYAGMFGNALEQFHFEEIQPFTPISAGEYEVVALPARHAPSEKAFVYVIKYKDKCIFYCLDTGWVFDETFAYIREKGYRFDMIALDCTSVDKPSADTAGHMNLQQCARVTEKLRENGNVDENTKIIVTHFSHNGNPIHSRLQKLCKTYGFTPAYDGMEVEI